MKRLFAIVVSLYPEHVQERDGKEINQIFNDLVDDPSVTWRRIWAHVLGDLANHGMGLGALFGSMVVLIWLANRVAQPVVDRTHMPSVALIVLLFVAAGLVGAQRSGTFTGGLWVGFVAASIGALTAPGDFFFFHTTPPGGTFDVALAWVTAAATITFCVAIGAVVADSTRRGERVDRSVRAFAEAWQTSPKLPA
jgi:hypothetical protein